VRNSTREEWHANSITIRHLTYVVTYARCCGEAETLSFLDRCIGHNWVDSQYISPRAHIGSLAGAVMSIVVNESEQIREFFRLPSLFDRLWREYPRCGGSASGIGAWLQLLGAACLLGNSFKVPSLQKFGPDRIGGALLQFAPRPETESIEFIQFNLWVGLREWCQISMERVKVEPKLAEIVLSQLKNSEPEQPRARMLKVLMLKWLESSKASAWRLSIERLPLRVALAKLTS
jgi:hypothetical protein